MNGIEQHSAHELASDSNSAMTAVEGSGWPRADH